MSESVAPPEVELALAEVRRLRAEGLVRLYPGDYVYLMDDPESGDEGQIIARYAALDFLLLHPVASSALAQRDPSSWSNQALDNYQRARSSAVTITNAAGESRTVSAWALEHERRRARRKRKQRS